MLNLLLSSRVFFFSVASTPNMGLELMTQRSRISCSTNWTNQVPLIQGIFFSQIFSFYFYKLSLVLFKHLLWTQLNILNIWNAITITLLISLLTNSTYSSVLSQCHLIVFSPCYGLYLHAFSHAFWLGAR